MHLLRLAAVAMLASGYSLFAAEQAEPAAGRDEEADLAKKLSNPVAALISVPLQSNWDFGGGPTGGGTKYTLNI